MKLEMRPEINSVLKIAKATQELQELPKTKLHCFQHQEIQKCFVSSANLLKARSSLPARLLKLR